MHPATPVLKTIVLLATLGALTAAMAEVEEQVVAPAEQNMPYAVSERGVHLAAVVRKGSRMTVVVDGVAGPKVDAVLTPSAMWIDPRPIQAEQAAANVSAGRHAFDQRTSPQPVTFSRDGRHFAYVARLSQEWVLMEDNQEVLRLPAGEGSNDFRLQFSGDDGKHLLFAHASYPGFELWVDGRKWPGFFGSGGGGSEGTIDPVISPDGQHVAYVAQIARDKRGLVVDGQEAAYAGYNLQYTADSKHLVCLAQTPKGTALLIDGKPLFTARQILAYYCAPGTNRVAAVLLHAFPDGSQGQFLLLDGKPVEATLCKNGIPAVVFSPDGRHYAALCSNAPNIFYVVSDGRKGDEYDAIGNPLLATSNGGLAFSPDSSRLVYTAHGGGKYFLVVNGAESDDAFDSINGFRFSPDGRRLAYSGFQNAQPKSPVVIDGKAERFERAIDINQFDFSPDGSRYAYTGAGQYGGTLYLDGQPTPLNARNFAFSPDGKHIAVAGYRPADNVNGLWVDGTLVYKGERNPDYLAFSADSQHLFWKVVEPDKEKPGYYDNVTYVDGTPAATGDNVNLYKQLTVPTGFSDFTVHPGWQVVGGNSLACLTVIGDSVKRITITPSGTDIASLIASAAAARPAKPSR